MQEAEYLIRFVRLLPDKAYAQASRLRLVQVLSAGYDRVNVAGARAARIPICSSGGANSVQWRSIPLRALQAPRALIVSRWAHAPGRKC
jgi:phosphoglycerate dehydrogenase-like enzyme